MIRQLLDPANAITATGLALSVLGIAATLAGRPELGVAIVLWALLADHLDGVVAARTRNRPPEAGKVGKSLDSLADLVSAGVFPSITLIAVSGNSPLSIAAAAGLVICSALRLSYFNAVGLVGGAFIGAPTTYAVPVTALVFLLAPWLPEAQFPLVLAGALALIALLHVTPIRVPRTTGGMYAVVTLYAVSASAILAQRSLL